MKKIVLINSILFLFVLSALLPVSVQAQNLASWQKIISDTDLIWGEGAGESAEEARQRADSDLLSRIQVSINISQSSKIYEREENETYKIDEEFTKDYSSFTGLYLRGLEHLTKQEGDRFRALAYISKKALDESFGRRKRQINDYIQQGLSAEKDNRTGEALRNFYRAYLLTFTYPDTININFTGMAPNADPSIALSNKINRIIEEIRVVSDTAYKDRDIIMAELSFKYRSKPVRSLRFSYYSGIGSGDIAEVIAGRIDIPLYDTPELPERKLVLSIEYVYEGEMAVADEIASLYRIFKDKTFNNQKTALLVFPWLGGKKKKAVEEWKDLTVSYPEPVLALAKLHTKSDFERILVQYKKLNKISYGKKDDFNGGINCFVAILDENSLYGVFHYDGMEYTEVTSGRKLLKLFDEFKSKTQIWIKNIG